ncbi:MAG: bifunctional transaldolase/phosoglucose isomerase [Candidatus Omnitrophica bacterium]|nr:bifunctional transaldolase/phosoglucose isomerase [Candidatus Omnitrophota bacterium]MDD5670964.1 bifunctional transaldolase/phosoglucose isomerase [Candidatus Omnitrophota bacterium]
MNISTRPLATIEMKEAGQSPWLDFIDRDLFQTGELKSLIERGVLGVTSNPTIFEKAITRQGSGYEKDILKMIRQGFSTFEIYDALTVTDIQKACDCFLPLFAQSDGEHGFVSLEVNPGLAFDEEGTVVEAKRLFKLVNRPNVMIKVPATAEGIPAIRRLIAEGVNVNITIIYSVEQYRQVAQAYLEGLNARLKAKGDIHKVHSVASVFVSRIDVVVDKKLNELADAANDPAQKSEYLSLCGKASVGNSKIIFQEFKNVIQSEEFMKLKAAGAWTQKLLWGSTSVKNPSYPDLIYVENMVGRDTVNTMTKATLESLMDHGRIEPDTVEKNIEETRQYFAKLLSLGIDIHQVCEHLKLVMAQQFCDSFDAIMARLERIRFERQAKKSAKSFDFKVQAGLPDSDDFKMKLLEMESNATVDRFFKKDPSLWKSTPDHQKVILNRLGWLKSPEWVLGKLYEMDMLYDEIRKEKIRDVVLLGMGGSSLAPEVLRDIFKKARAKSPRLSILDTTDPETILDLERSVNLKSTLFIVASKSGSTVETTSQFKYFYHQLQKKYAKAKYGAAKLVGRHFVAITDAGSWLENRARELQFRKVFVNPSDIGGRYSALSFFGLLPAALIGIDLRPILKQTLDLIKLSMTEKTLSKNPAIYLGALMGAWANRGQNKLNFWISPSLSPIAAWLEQLIAESTGKEGKGILPVTYEDMSGPDVYGKDHVFVWMRQKSDVLNQKAKERCKEIKKAGFPVVEMVWPDIHAIGSEFLRLEIATSIASAVMGINPFDEPNVKESKDLTNKILDTLKQTGKLENPSGLLSFNGKSFISNGKPMDGEPLFREFFAKLGKTPEGYIVFLAYTPRAPEISKEIQKMRNSLREHYKVPVLIGFGPRYLHSIGQLYKGGDRKGLFIEFLMQDKKNAAVPETHYSFSQLKRAQALGDYEALKQKNISVLAFDVGYAPLKGIKAFKKELYQAIGMA